MKEVLKLIERAMIISKTCKADVFVYYSPHVKWVKFNIHSEGWISGNGWNDSHTIELREDNDSIIEQISEPNKAFDELEKQK